MVDMLVVKGGMFKVSMELLHDMLRLPKEDKIAYAGLSSHGVGRTVA